MIDYKKIFKDRELRLKLISGLKYIPTKPYLKAVYWIKTGKHLNLDNPRTFCEKSNWLKLNDVHPEYTDLVDKINVRPYVNSIMGEDMFFPLYGAWEHYKDINFDELPERFVLKCNHDSGSAKIIKSKSEINHEELNKFFEDRLRLNPYVIGREYPYKNVKPMIMAEAYMTPQGEENINDYKFFCFNGKPEIMFIATDRSTDVKFDFFDMEFNHLDIVNIHPQSGQDFEKPKNFDKMVEIAANLSQGMKFVRIDLYDVNGKIYFGEYTFFHGGGFWPFSPEEWEEKLGNLIEI